MTNREKFQEDKIVLPMPEWYKQGTEYWAHACVAFHVATPSDAYAKSSVELMQPFGVTKDVHFYGDLYAPSRPYVFWSKPGTIFGD